MCYNNYKYSVFNIQQTIYLNPVDTVYYNLFCIVNEQQGVIMLDKKPDKRILHTKFFLKNALLGLMKTKPIEKITTTELCAAADINRNTFYSHYSTPEEVLDEIVNEELQEVKALLNNSSDRERLHNLYSHFKEKKEFYKIFIFNKNSSFSEKIMSLCKEHNIYQWQYPDNPDNKLSEMYFLFASSGSMSIINDWIIKDCAMPIDELQDIIDNLSLRGLSALKNKQ